MALSLGEQHAQILRASPEELESLARLALGRLFRLGSRPFQEGDSVSEGIEALGGLRAAREAFESQK